MTREDRIYQHYRSLRRGWDWRNSSKTALFMYMARKWKTPIREIKAIISDHKGPSDGTHISPKEPTLHLVRLVR